MGKKFGGDEKTFARKYSLAGEQASKYVIPRGGVLAKADGLVAVGIMEATCAFLEARQKADSRIIGSSAGVMPVNMNPSGFEGASKRWMRWKYFHYECVY